MRFLQAIIDSLVSFVQRNPLLVLIILILAIGAPALLKGIAMFVLYFFLGLVVLAVCLVLAFRWRIYKLQKQMGDNYRPENGFESFFGGQTRPTEDREGDVKVHKTNTTPEKKISSEVGDYVDFEEEKKE